MSELSKFEQMGADPERYAREFTKRFALVTTDRGFVDTLEIMRAWFFALACAVREKTLEEHARSIALLERRDPASDTCVVCGKSLDSIRMQYHVCQTCAQHAIAEKI